MPASYIYINDSGANTWAAGVNTDGILGTVAVPAQSPPVLYLNDFESHTTTWRLDIDTSGVLATTSQTFDPSKPDSFSLKAPDSTEYLLQVYTDGIFRTLVILFKEQSASPRGLQRLARLTP